MVWVISRGDVVLLTGGVGDWGGVSDAAGSVVDMLCEQLRQC